MTDFEKLKEKVVHDFPETPGVYTMRGAKNEILYIGKAGNLRRRVLSYFLRAHDARIEKLMQEVREIEYEETDTALEALILESKLIKEKHPVYNIREQDDKSFLYVAVTREAFPRVLLVRGKDVDRETPANVGRFNLLREVKPPKTFGPFTSGTSIREAMRILRRIFPWSVHSSKELLALSSKLREGNSPRGCFDYEVGLCPGTCIGAVDKNEYRKNIRRLVGIFEGKKNRVIRELEREMDKASKELEFEKATKLRKQIFALQHIHDIALIRDEGVASTTYNLPPTTYRIEGYDISNISGTSAVGSMVVFSAGGGSASGGKNFYPDKSEYRKFRIRTVAQSDDVGMIKEVLRRRFARHGAFKVRPSAFSPPTGGWALPHLVLIDGGRGQVNAAKEVLNEMGLQIPIVGMAKGPTRKKTEIIGKIPEGVALGTLVQVRDEAHRFAIAYHKKLRSVRSFQ